MIAQELTLAHAEWVGKLVLVATIPGWTAQPPYAAPHHLPARPVDVMASQARRQQFVHKTLGPKPCAAGPDRRALGGPKLARPQSQQGELARYRWRRSNALGNRG
jgi:pimeloyl-ACP methyl ester carboxylesterase